MEILNDLLLGFSHILTPNTILFATIGCALGMLTGILPGFGPAAATALLLPLAFLLESTASIVMIAAIYYGSMYGGTITSVLLNVPGEVSSVATGIDGYQMTRRGKAGKALTIAAVGSFVGGMIAFLAMAFFADWFAEVALFMTFVDVFALAFLALFLVIGIGGKSMTKGLISAALGLLISTVGLDNQTGVPRFTFGFTEMTDGISFISVIMGLFGLSEILRALGAQQPPDFSANIGSTRLSWHDIRVTLGSMGRGTIVGFFFGLVPGSPAAAASFTTYALEKRFSKNAAEFGHGAIQGVAAPETANNALGISNFIPLLTLGIPSSSTMAVLLGAFVINGLQPGPLLFQQHPEIAWGVIASLALSNVILLIMALPLVQVWVSILRVPLPILYSVTLGIMVIGAYTVNSSMSDVWVMVIAGLLGVALNRLDVPLTPMALTIVLGSMLEGNFRRALVFSDGNLSTFVSTTASQIAFIGVAVIILFKVGSAIRRFLLRRNVQLVAS